MKFKKSNLKIPKISNSLCNPAAINRHMSHQIGINDSWMHRVHCNASAGQFFCQFVGEHNVSQFTLIVSCTLIVLLITIQIVDVDFSTFMSDARYDYNATGAGFLNENADFLSTSGMRKDKRCENYLQLLQQQ